MSRIHGVSTIFFLAVTSAIKIRVLDVPEVALSGHDVKVCRRMCHHT